MFAAFVAAHRAAGFAIYPECCGHDLVMVAPDPLLPPTRSYSDGWGDLRPGDVVAVEGKLRAFRRRHRSTAALRGPAVAS